jgi:hypothetical protein
MSESFFKSLIFKIRKLRTDLWDNDKGSFGTDISAVMNIFGYGIKSVTNQLSSILIHTSLTCPCCCYEKLYKHLRSIKFGIPSIYQPSNDIR